MSLAAIGASIERFDPTDESKADPSFVAFKSELKVAIQKKNAAFITKILSDDVEYSFGADPERKSAVDGFVRHYRINDGKGSSFWESLREVVDLGCTKSDKDFVCPYVYSKWPDQFDSYSFVASIKAKAAIRAKPDSSAEILRFAGFEILKLDTEKQTTGWYAVDLGNGKIGFIARSDVRSPIGYRVKFQKTSDGWKLKYFIAGD